MKKTCKDCHFLIREGISLHSENFNQHYKSSLSTKNRLNIDDFIELFSPNSPAHIKCEKNVWDLNTFDNITELKNTILSLNRSKCIFYKKYHEHMDLSAANEFLNEEKQKSESRKNFFIALIAIILSCISTITSVIALLK